MISPIVWVAFFILVAALLYLDLGILNKRAHSLTMREAVVNSAIWISLGLLFSVFIYFGYENQWYGMGTLAHEPNNGKSAVLKYLTGYLLEEALSVDNLFVMAVIFAQFKVPKAYQHKVLFWGILGVVVFRGLLIGVGIGLITRFQWLFVFFGVLLIYTAFKMLKHDDAEEDLSQNKTVKFLNRLYPVSPYYDGDKFFTMINGAKAMTPMFVALMVVETTDVMFAFDSVPAVFSITTDPFLVFASNIFAILGLRALYFVLSNVMDKFKYLNYSLLLILLFIGVKMILIPFHIHIHELVSLAVVGALLLFGIVASWWSNKKMAE